MATIGPESFNTWSQGGSGAVWSGILTPITGYKYGPVSPYSKSSNTMYFSVPASIGSIEYGCVFQSMTVSMGAYYDGSGPDGKMYCKLTGGDLYTVPITNSYTGYSLSGDADYWGLSDSPAEIFRKIKDGTIKFEIYMNGATTGYFAIPTVTLTYALPDTKRASIICTLP